MKKPVYEEQLCEHLTFGFDLGIASCGWSVLDEREPHPTIVAAGTWMFDAPETDKERKLKNVVRRTNRGMRRNIRRRAQRMDAVRRLFAELGLIDSANKHALEIADTENPKARLNPWRCRAEGLDRLLSNGELAVALGHIARHRGYRSNSKSGEANLAPDDKKMLKGAAEFQEKSGKYRTLGQALWIDPELSQKKRNRSDSYSRTPMRRELEHEARLLIRKQRGFGNAVASEDFEAAYIGGALFDRPYSPPGKHYPPAPKIGGAFFQRPLQNSVALLGDCPFVPNEKRASKRCYSFERFRLLSRLVNLSIDHAGKRRRLTREEVRIAAADFGAQRKLTYKTLRTRLQLPPEAGFAGVPSEKEAHDIAARKGDAAAGSYILRQTLGEHMWSDLSTNPEKLDFITFVLTFYEDVQEIEAQLVDGVADASTIAAVMSGVQSGAFGDWTGAGHISAAACRILIPHLEAGLTYDAACEAVGWDHSAPRNIELSDISSPVARKALSEVLKQCKALIREFGRPGRIHIEMARDVGKGIEERQRIERGLDRRNAEMDKAAAEFASPDIAGRPPRRGTDELLRYELWKEQLGRCLYCDTYLSPRCLVTSDNSVQVDHILPIGRFGDDSFLNKTLCCSGCNQNKRARTPHEWLSASPQTRWEHFEVGVNGNPNMKGMKKRNYLLKDASEVEGAFRSRNLNDTRWACRAFLAEAAKFYPEQDGKRRIFARPGRITSRFRIAWGVQSLKYGSDGNRISDERNHALDAIVTACVSEGYLQRATRQLQREEESGGHRSFVGLPPPWASFREDVLAAFDQAFVARAERRRARGKAHDATIKQVREVDGRTVVYERKAVEKLTLKDLDRIKGAERNGNLIGELARWIDNGKPADSRPLSPKGDPVRKVRIATTDKSAVRVRGGTADRGDMVRVDVFVKPGRRGQDEYYLVPIYPHQIADRSLLEPPSYAAASGGTSVPLGDEYAFRFSLYPMSFIEITKRDGEIIEGYFRGANVNTISLKVSSHNRSDLVRDSIGAKTLHGFRKFSVDRLGRCSEVKQEKRTWRGAACISRSLPNSP
jgi:CRISPR-associated endonuclease Csn1